MLNKAQYLDALSNCHLTRSLKRGESKSIEFTNTHDFAVYVKSTAQSGLVIHPSNIESLLILESIPGVEVVGGNTSPTFKLSSSFRKFPKYSSNQEKHGIELRVSTPEAVEKIISLLKY